MRAPWSCVAIATTRRPQRAARHAWLFVIPASFAGWLWISGAATPFTYVLTASVGDPWPPPRSSAYLITGTPALELPASSVPLSLGALVVLLWTLTALGLVALVRDARPDTGAAHALAVVASVLTLPLWVAPLTRHLSTGVLDLSRPTASLLIEAVRTLALALVVAIGAAVVRSRERVPARSSAYALPAVLLTWLAWSAHLGPAQTYTFGAFSSAPLPTWVDVLPWTVSDACAVALVLILWIQATRGARALLSRYRPPEALLTP